eukprot:TRINITY_DN6509_c0_g1_i1.p1 TRINITY_DN6509_c0_g1~~TRINITY_DN6509_c0_g1_i1.p1  ORF type:complete len:837 (+),score=233.56 TRINITY_DN6509_c0_g1_i1:60-2513(+)
MEALQQYLISCDIGAIATLLASDTLSREEKAVVSIAEKWAKAEFNDILKEESMKTLLSSFIDEDFTNYEEALNKLEKSVSEFLNQQEDEKPILRQLLVILAGITYLHMFAQVNFTGPSSSFKKTTPEIRAKLVSKLDTDGESAYTKLEYPELLLAARILLVDHSPSLSLVKTAPWWKARCCFVHQRIMTGKSASLKEAMTSSYNICKELFGNIPANELPAIDNLSDGQREMGARVHLEEGNVLNYYRSGKKTGEALNMAQIYSGLNVNMTGISGRRTRFQEFDTPQLVLLAESRESKDSKQENKEISKPLEVKNEEQLFLDAPKLVTPVDEKNLHITDQAIILALCNNVKNQNPADGLTTEQMAPYVRRVLVHANNWLVYSQGLLIKSRLENENSKTVERGAMQLQALADQYEADKTDPQIRLRHFFSVTYPSRWELKREVGERFIALGAAATALQIFEELEMWEEMITCYQIMEKVVKAEELIRKRLEEAPKPILWCLLGDIKQDDQYYHKAWEISGKSFARAMRSLGRSSFSRRDFAKSVEYYKEGLAINPLYAASWFNMGCAAMQIQAWDDALNAFSRVVALEPEEGEAWGNMSAVYMTQKKMQEAYKCLQEGLKQKRESWKMWENFLTCCIEIKDFQQALHCYHRLMELKDKYVDISVLHQFVKAVIDEVPDKSGESSSKYQKQVAELFGRVTSQVSTNPELWQLYALFNAGTNNREKELDCLLKVVRYSEIAGWEKDKILFEKVAKANAMLARAYISSDDSKNIYSSKLKIRSTLKKTQDTFGDTEAHKNLVITLQDLEEKEKLLREKSNPQ